MGYASLPPLAYRYSLLIYKQPSATIFLVKKKPFRGGLALTQIFLLFSEKTCILALGAGSISLGSLQVARYCSDAVNVEFLRCFGQMLKEEERNLDLKIWNGKTHRTFVDGYIYIYIFPSLFFFSTD